MAKLNYNHLEADPEVLDDPESYYDKIIEIDLSTLEAHINGPFTPDATSTISNISNHLRNNGYPEKIEVSLIGSCTNSSYEDLTCAASVIEDGLAKGLKPKAKLIINPGSEQIRATAQRDGIIDTFNKVGATIMACACGPCIGQWKRITDDNNRKNSITTSFNRNFAKRADGNPNTHAFIVSPAVAAAFSFSGTFEIEKSLNIPKGIELPAQGFVKNTDGYIAPCINGNITPVIKEDSERLQKLEPFKPYDKTEFDRLPLLIKVKGKCTTDHISMAGPWLKYRGHLQNISENLLLGAIDAFSGKSGPIAPRAKELGRSIIVAEENYGEGSSREHAAMEPRYLGVKAILAKSFARIHETNLKKQGILALTFANPDDYDKIMPDDRISINCDNITHDKDISLIICHNDGNEEVITAKHTYNNQQIIWFKAGSALNSLWKK